MFKAEDVLTEELVTKFFELENKKMFVSDLIGERS